jgi:hypothetical protein
MIPIPRGPSHMGNFVRAVRDSAVRHIVFLSSLSTQSDIDGDLVGRFHRETEEALIALDIPLTLLRPSTFMANACYWAPQLQAGDMVKRIPYEAAAPIDEYDIARVAFAALTDRSLAGRTFPLTGPEAISSEDQVGIRGEILGRKLRSEPLDPDEIPAMIWTVSETMRTRMRCWKRCERQRTLGKAVTRRGGGDWVSRGRIQGMGAQECGMVSTRAPAIDPPGLRSPLDRRRAT